MKKLFVVLAIGAFAACNNSASTETKSAGDSTKVDSPAAVTPDTTAAKADTTAKIKSDSTVKADSTKK